MIICHTDFALGSVVIQTGAVASEFSTAEIAFGHADPLILAGEGAARIVTSFL